MTPSSKMKIGVLYIATGKYDIFWKEFFDSSEKFFLIDHEIHYFVFTDADQLYMEGSSRVHKFHQESLPWPLPTLRRFSTFQKARRELEGMDFLYFFNANMMFIDYIDESFLPAGGKTLAFLRHPLQCFRERDKFTYDRNKKSLAYIPFGHGEHYFMGALNGGVAASYLSMVDELEKRVADDERRNVLALWHDESHLNWYAIQHKEKVLPLDPCYGYPEGRSLPFLKKIVILDKALRGGSDHLRGVSDPLPWYRRILSAVRPQR